MLASLSGRLGDGGVNATDRGVYAPLPVIPTSSDEEGIADDNSDICLPGHPTAALQAITLRRVPARLPWSTYAIALVEFAERASFYGVVSIVPNFIQRPLPPGGPGTGAPPKGSEITPGALGKGLQVSTGLTVLFTLLGYTTPLIGGALADIKWGKYKTIMVGVVLATISHVVLVWAAIPSLLQSGKAFLPFLMAMFLLCSSTGLIKANVAPIMAEQYAPPGDYVETSADGERFIVDREATIQKIMSAYFASINTGAFMAILSSFAEKYVGFWLAFLIPGIVCLLMPFLLISIYPYLIPSPPPSSSPLVDAVRAVKLGAPDTSVPEDDIRREESKNVLDVCRFFLFFAVYNVADGGLYSLFTSLTGSMTTHSFGLMLKGIPNDFLGHATPLAIVISIPTLNIYVYPFLQDREIPFGPVRRVVTGFVFAGLAMAWCALLQELVYKSSPCGYQATYCDEGTGVSPLSAWLILPTPIMLGISEAIAVVAAMEIGYVMSPPGLRSIVNAIFLFTQSLASILVLFFVPIMHDPLLVCPFLVTACVVFIAAWGVWRVYGHLDDRD